MQPIPGSTGRPAGPRSARLPQLRPHINKQAQRIIASHMCEEGSSSSSRAGMTMRAVPVLQLIESTAPKTARTHDISHLCDRSAYLTPTIPPSLVAEADHIYEKTFLPKDSSSVYNEEDQLWHTKVFPSSTPSSRIDAVMLDNWITRSLERYKDKPSEIQKEDLAHAIEDLVPIFTVALHEIVRQVTHHCVERGVALEKIWRTYVELFDRVLRQMLEALRKQKQKTTEVQGVLTTARADLAELRKNHPEHMHKVIADLEVEFTRRQVDFERELDESEEENRRLKQELRIHHRELEHWYPGFATYQDSFIRKHLPQHQRTGTVRSASKRGTTPARPGSAAPPGSGAGGRDAGEVEEEISPEVAIARDFKRLLAVLAPDKRKTIGKELAFIMDLSSSQAAEKQAEKTSEKHAPRRDFASSGGDDSTDEAERKKLQAEVKMQELRITQLREEILALETLQVQQVAERVTKKQDDDESMSPRGAGLLKAAQGLLDIAAGRRDKNPSDEEEDALEESSTEQQELEESFAD